MAFPAQQGFAPSSRHFCLPLPEEPPSVSKTAAPQLPRRLCGDWEGALRSQGGATPRPEASPQSCSGTGPQGLCRFTRSLSWVEPKVRFYCTSQKILAGLANPGPSPVRGLWGLSWLFPRKRLRLWAENERPSPGIPWRPLSWQRPGTGDQKPLALGMPEFGRAVWVFLCPVKAGWPHRGDWAGRTEGEREAAAGRPGQGTLPSMVRRGEWCGEKWWTTESPYTHRPCGDWVKGHAPLSF